MHAVDTDLAIVEADQAPLCMVKRMYTLHIMHNHLPALLGRAFAKKQEAVSDEMEVWISKLLIKLGWCQYDAC